MNYDDLKLEILRKIDKWRDDIKKKIEIYFLKNVKKFIKIKN